MLCSCQNGVSGKLSRWMPALAAVSIVFFVNCQPTKADVTDTTTPNSSTEKAPVTWISGPTNIVVGEIEIEVMDGFKFTDAAGARAILAPRNTLPRGLIGFLASNAQSLGMVLA